MATLSQYMLSSAATFGFFMSIGSVSFPSYPYLRLRPKSMCCLGNPNRVPIQPKCFCIRSSHGDHLCLLQHASRTIQVPADYPWTTSTGGYRGGGQGAMNQWGAKGKRSFIREANCIISKRKPQCNACSAAQQHYHSLGGPFKNPEPSPPE